MQIRCTCAKIRPKPDRQPCRAPGVQTLAPLPPAPPAPRPSAAKVLMISLFTAHRDWVPDAQRPEGHMEAVQVLHCTCLRFKCCFVESARRN